MQHDVSATDGAVRSTVREERGQTLVEYALIIAVVSLGALTALGFLSGKIQSLFSKAGSSIEAVSVGSGGASGPTAPVSATVTINCPGGSCSSTETAVADPSPMGGTAPVTYGYQWAFNFGGCGASSGWTTTLMSTSASQFLLLPGAYRVTVTATNTVGSAQGVGCITI